MNASSAHGEVERAAGEQRGHDGRDHRGAEVAHADHGLAPDGVEEPSERQRAEQVAGREHDQEHGHERRGDLVEGGVQRAEVEGDAVVEEGLADEQRQAQDGAARVLAERRVGDLGERRLLALAHRDALVGLGQLLAGLLGDPLLDVVDDPLGLLLAAVDEQPARALRDVAPHQQDGQAEDRADPEGDPPADVGGQQRGVEEDDRGHRAEDRAHPEGAVDDQVDAAANTRPGSARRSPS